MSQAGIEKPSQLPTGGREFSPRKIRALLWCVAIGLGILRCYFARNSMNPDGISYIDLGDAFWRGDWDMALSSYWSPLYAWLLGLVLLIIRPSPYWEFSVVHALNFLVYLTLLVSFDLFWRELQPHEKDSVEGSSEKALVPLPAWSWVLLGNALAIWCALHMLGLASVSPDLLLAALVCLAAYFLVRIRIRSASWKNFALLGVVLGLMYLAKTAMLPIAFVFLVVSILAPGNLRRAIPLALVAIVAFLCVSGPFVTALSISKGRFTIGDSARINYYYSMYGASKIFGGSEGGTPIPFEFPSAVGGTYPLWYDPSFLIQRPGQVEDPAPKVNVFSSVNLKRQIQVLMNSANHYFDIFFLRQGHMVAGVLFLLFAADRPFRMNDALRNWYLLVPVLAAFGMYAVVYVDDRYVGPFIPLFWGAVLNVVRVTDSDWSRRMVTFISIIVAGLFLLQIVGITGRDMARELQGSRYAHWEAADGLHRLGLQPGDKVGVIGGGIFSYWARLGRFRIVAEIDTEDARRFWDADLAAQQKAIEAFARSGAKAVVTRGVLSPSNAGGWVRIGRTELYAYLLDK